MELNSVECMCSSRMNVQVADHMRGEGKTPYHNRIQPAGTPNVSPVRAAPFTVLKRIREYEHVRTLRCMGI